MKKGGWYFKFGFLKTIYYFHIGYTQVEILPGLSFIIDDSNHHKSYVVSMQWLLWGMEIEYVREIND